jgi:hypothetical protein
MTDQLTPFQAKFVSDVLEHPSGLYARTLDAVVRITADGEVTTLHTFEEQSPFGFKGLALQGSSLLTFDHPLVGSPVLTQVGFDGQLQRHGDASLRRPSGLVVEGKDLILLDQLVPLTEISVWRGGRIHPLAEARNLTHWLVSDERLLWSEHAGIRQWRSDGATWLVEQPGILTFNRRLDWVAQRLEDGQVVMTVNTGIQQVVIQHAEHPVALYTLPADTLIRWGRQLAPIETPEDRRVFSEAEEPGALIAAGERLLHLKTAHELVWSTDARTWTSISLPLNCTRLIQAGEHAVIASGRQGSVLIQLSS